MSSRAYDLAVIGSGPAGQKAALAAAELDKRAVIIDRRSMLGGVCLHTGTIPSKTLREAALYLSGFRQRAFYGKDYTLKARIDIEDLMLRVHAVVKSQQAVVNDQLRRNGVEFLEGTASFRDPHALQVEAPDRTQTLAADYILIACGTRPVRRPDIPFGHRIVDSDQLLRAVEGELPKTAIVVGAGVIGLEYASIMAAVGVQVTVIDAKSDILDFVDDEIVEALTYHLRQNNVTFRLGEKVASVSREESGLVAAHLESKKTIRAEALLYAVGRQGNADRVHLEAAGLEADERGRLRVNENFQTQVSHIYAAGDVIGFPMLASTSMEQGRLASCHMFGTPFRSRPGLLPYGIYTIPEVSMVGSNERQLTEQKVPYEVGLARFEEVAKAQILGDQTGLLKLIFHAETLELLGVHIMGDQASELVHIGQAVMGSGNTIEILRDCVFNYPTLAEAYKLAAVNGLSKVDKSRLSAGANPK